MQSHLFREARRWARLRCAVIGAVCTVIVLAFLFGSNAALAQTASTGALTGIITDPSGGVVPGAAVDVTNLATGDRHDFTTQANGGYLAPLLLPGTYRIEVSKSGFKTAVLEGIIVAVTETNTLNVKLQVGEITQ